MWLDPTRETERFEPAPAGAPAATETGAAELDRAVAELGDAARAFAHLSPLEKAALLRATIPRLLASAERQVAAACAAKGIDPASALAGEEWLAGPYPVITNVRLLSEALEDIARRGRPRLRRGAVKERGDGRVEVALVPEPGAPGLLQAGFCVHALMQPGTRRADVFEKQARHYRAPDPPDGAVALVLGAGNVASIPAMDALHKLFVEGRVVLLKTSPVNAYLGPFFEDAFAPLVERGFLRIVHGGPEVGAYLCDHAGIAEIHVTGSAATHDRIVWGPPGPERERRKAAGTPRLAKRITSELGNVSPVIVVPYLFARDELWFQARSIASQVVNNASFNCNAAKMLVLAKGWPQRDLFLDMLRRALAEVPCRKAYYPGAGERYAALTSGRAGVERIGEAGYGALPWTLVTGLDPERADEPLFSTEPFCGLLSEVAVGSADPIELLDAATRFCNERLWGTLSASLVVPPRHEEDPALAAAVDRAILSLRYGAIAVNHWPALAYGFVVPPWGGHPSATLADVQSGIGFVHDTAMLDGVEKVVVRGPLRAVPRPVYFYDNRRMREIGERLCRFAAAPSLGAALGIAWNALRA